MSTRWPPPYYCSMRSIFPIDRALPALALASLLLTGCGGSGTGNVRVIVPNRATFRGATDSLARAGLVGWKYGFRGLARLEGKDRRIKAGTYDFPRSSSWPELIDALHNGTGMVSTVTIPEGFTVAQIAPVLAGALQVPLESVMVAMRDSTFRKTVQTDGETLEGYLFPDTYSFPVGTRARDAVRQMVDRFQKVWKPEWNAALDSLHWTRQQAVTLASIIEKEAKVPDERPVIAAVYKNRLGAKMPLQADATVQYALGKHVERVFYKDLAVKSPYNTYLHSGLPPGPIASPGAASLTAAVHPADVPYLYYVAMPDGHHEFRKTLAEHEKAKKLAKEAQRKSGDTAAQPIIKKEGKKG